MMMMMFAPGGGSVNPVLATFNLFDSRVAISSTAGVTFNTDGTLTYQGNACSGSTNWFVPQTLGIGSRYWVKLVQATGTAPSSGPALGAWTLMSSSASWSWTVIRSGGGSTRNFTGTLYISSDGTDTGIVVSAPVNVSVEASA